MQVGQHGLFADLTLFNIYLTTYPLYPPPFIREGEEVIPEGLRPSNTPYKHI